jgi:hypothetical protein
MSLRDCWQRCPALLERRADTTLQSYTTASGIILGHAESFRAKLWANRGLAKSRKGDSQGAADDYERAKKLKPQAVKRTQ